MFVINKSYIFVVKLSKTLVVKIFKYERIGLFEDWKRLQVNPIFSSYYVYIFETKLLISDLELVSTANIADLLLNGFFFFKRHNVASCKVKKS